MSRVATVGARFDDYGGVCSCGTILLFPRDERGRPVPVSQVRCPHCGRMVQFEREEDDSCRLRW